MKISKALFVAMLIIFALSLSASALPNNPFYGKKFANSQYTVYFGAKLEISETEGKDRSKSEYSIDRINDFWILNCQQKDWDGSILFANGNYELVVLRDDKSTELYAESFMDYEAYELYPTISTDNESKGFEVSNFKLFTPHLPWLSVNEELPIELILDNTSGGSIIIVPGYCSSKSLEKWREYSRPKKVRFITDYNGAIYEKEYKDEPNIEIVRFPKSSFSPWGNKTRMIIDSVYEGTKYHQVAISEIIKGYNKQGVVIDEPVKYPLPE